MIVYKSCILMQKVKIKGKNRGFYMVKKNIELRVRNLIEKYGTKNPYKICEKLNINIIYTDLGSIKGYFQKVLRKKYIVINESLNQEDRMVVLCHELGHAILHQTKEVNFMKKNFIYYSNALENEANEFAREILKYQYHSYVYSDCMLLNEILK